MNHSTIKQDLKDVSANAIETIEVLEERVSELEDKIETLSEYLQDAHVEISDLRDGQLEYWRNRCKAAESYLAEIPVQDRTSTVLQRHAFNAWEESFVEK